MCNIGLITPFYLPHRIKGDPKDTRIIQLKKGKERKGREGKERKGEEPQQTSNWVSCSGKVELVVVREY